MSTTEFQMPLEIKNKIRMALEKNGLELSCPRCGNDNFYIADGFIIHILQQDPSTNSLDGPGIVCAAVICNKCGFVSEHSLSVLGVINEIREFFLNRTDRKS